MNRSRLNGASLHAEQPAPDALLCWKSALNDRREALRAELASLAAQVKGYENLTETRLSCVRLAEEVARADAGDLERLRDRLNEYDAETERLLAESAGRLKSLRARIAHRQNPAARAGLAATAEDVAALESELRCAERADGQLLGRRLAEREPLRRAWLDAARRGLTAGLQLLALADPDLPTLAAAAERTRALRAELAEVDRLHARTNDTTTT